MGITLFIIVALMFSVMAAISLPLRILYGDNNSVTDEESETLEVFGDLPNVQETVPLVSIQKQHQHASITLLHVSRHRPFTAALLALAKTYPHCALLSISGNAQLIQVRVTTTRGVSTHKAISQAVQKLGGRHIDSYVIPGDAKQERHILFAVPIPKLIECIVAMPDAVEIAQIYDFI